MIFLFYSSLFVTFGVVLIESQSQDRMNSCISEGTNKLCVQPEVIGMRGDNVILPCLFTHDEGHLIKDLSLMLFKAPYKEPGSKEELIYTSKTNYIHRNFKERLQTVGKPSEGNGSVRIRDLKMEDEGMYTFSFQFNNRGKTYVLKTRKGNETELRVNVRPQIVDLRMEFTNDNTSSRLFCKAEAKPRPNITWLNPKQHLVDASEVLVDENVPNKLQIVSILRITGKKLAGNYSCLVKNKYGLARRHIFYKGFKYERIFYVIVGWSTILVLYLIFLLAYGSCIYNRKFEKAKSIKGTLPTKGPKETRTFAGMCHQMNSLAPSSGSCDYTDFEVPQVDCVYAVVQMSKS